MRSGEIRGSASRANSRNFAALAVHPSRAVPKRDGYPVNFLTDVLFTKYAIRSIR